MAKTLPASLLKPPDPQVKDLAVGEVGYLPPSSLSVTPDLSCWIRPKARIERQRDRVFSLKITRTEKGYDVVVTTDWQWTADAPPVWVEGDIRVNDISVDLVQDDL